ncbi:MAG: hypothetical protein O3C51_17435 [Planctomycetota bacterium]|nr:hypothetical protein [Planctomycetota bacterium]
MKSRPYRTTTAGRAYLELRRLAAARGRATAELLQLYALEGCLARLQISSHAERYARHRAVPLGERRGRLPRRRQRG